MISRGTLRLAGLLTTLTVLLVLSGYLLGGVSGTAIAFGLALSMNAGVYWMSDRVALAMVGGREVSDEEAPGLHRLLERLAARAGLPKPRLYMIEASTPNAFATGRDPAHAAVAVTAGITQALNRDELAGVLAHELAHVKNRDTLIAALVAIMAGAITMLAGLAQWGLIFGGIGGKDEDGGPGGGGPAGFMSGLLLIFLAPIAALIIQTTISRSREYAADSVGAAILGDPLPLARALEKLDLINQAVPLSVNPAAAHQFTVQPLAPGRMMSLFNTHPTTARRVSRLREMALHPTFYE